MTAENSEVGTSSTSRLNIYTHEQGYFTTLDSKTYRIPISCETAEQTIREFFLVNPEEWFSYENLRKMLNHVKMPVSQGYLYNVISKLCQGKHPYLERQRCYNTAQFRLCEIGPVGCGELGSKRVSVQFKNYFDSLDWNVDTRVHNPHYWTPVGSLVFVNSSWCYSRQKKKYTLKVMHDGFAFIAKAHENAKTLEVHQKCSRRPFKSSSEGLLKMYECLVSFRASYLNHCDVPYCGDWIVKAWHYGKDTKNTLAGASFEITVHNWLGELLRLYTIAEFGEVRLEVQENLGLKWTQILGREESWRIHAKYHGTTDIQCGVL